MLVAEQQKLLYCAIPKIGFSHWIKLIIYMNNNGANFNKLLDASFSTLYNMYHDKYELSPNVYTAEQIQLRLLNYFKFVFVRHPLERLLSAYEDKFGKNEPHRALYLKLYAPYIASLCRNATSSIANQNKGDDITFSHFLCYVARAPSDKLDIHWTPYVEICDFCNPHWNFDFIGKFETLEEEANYLLDKIGVKELRFPAGYRSKEEQRLRFQRVFATIPSQIVDSAVKRFQSDFSLFGYDKYPYEIV